MNPVSSQLTDGSTGRLGNKQKDGVEDVFIVTLDVVSECVP